MMIPGNPYALIKDKVVTEIYFAQEKPQEQIDQELSALDWDRVINCTEHGGEIFIGETISETGKIQAMYVYPSWIWNDTVGRWEAPTPYPQDSTENWTWEEDSLGWVICEGAPPSLGDSSECAGCGSSAQKYLNQSGAAHSAATPTYSVDKVA